MLLKMAVTIGSLWLTTNSHNIQLTVLFLDFGHELLWVNHSEFLFVSCYLYKEVSQDRKECFCLPTASGTALVFALLVFGLLVFGLLVFALCLVLLFVCQHLITKGLAEIQRLENRVRIARVTKLCNIKQTMCHFSQVTIM